MSYESAAQPIELGYLMNFLLSEDYPQDRRDDLTIPFDLGETTHLIGRFGADE